MKTDREITNNESIQTMTAYKQLYHRFVELCISVLLILNLHDDRKGNPKTMRAYEQWYHTFVELCLSLVFLLNYVTFTWRVMCTKRYLETMTAYNQFTINL